MARHSLKNQQKTNERISMNIVKLLQSRGLTLKQIGEMIGHTESYISRVARGQRSFTIEHLTSLEKQLREPLPVLLLKSIDKENLDKQMRPLYQHLKNLLSRSRKTSTSAKYKVKAAG